MQPEFQDIFVEPSQIANSLYKNFVAQYNNDPLKYRSDLFLVSLTLANQISITGYPFKKKDFCGLLTIDEYENTITYNSQHSPERRNFTIAHELGHYYMHREKESQFVDRAANMLNNCDSEFEKQANAFAAELMLPQSVINIMISYRYSFYRMAKTTKTSYECLKWRLVTNFMKNFGMSRDNSLEIIEDYKYSSNTKDHEASAFFKIIFPGSNIYKIKDGEFLEISRHTNNIISTKPLMRNRSLESISVNEYTFDY